MLQRFCLHRNAQMNDREKKGGGEREKEGRKDKIFHPLVSSISTQISLVGFYAKDKLASGLL